MKVHARVLKRRSKERMRDRKGKKLEKRSIKQKRESKDKYK